MEQAFDNTLGKKEWNKVITTEVGRALGAQLDGDFTAVNYNAGFSYVIQQYEYNAESLQAFDTKVVTQDGISVLENDYSGKYKDVIGSMRFQISKEDDAIMKREALDQQALISTILTCYRNSGIDDGTVPKPQIPDIMRRIREVTGHAFNKVDPREYPYLIPLCHHLCEYTRKAVTTGKILLMESDAEDRLSSIKQNITTPKEENGGLETKKGYKIGWDNIIETSQLVNSLKNSGNKISITISANNFHDNSTHLNINNSAKFVVPVSWLFHMEGDHTNRYDLSKYAKNGAEISVTLNFGGISVIPVNPAVLSADNKKGWYASDILKEAAAKSGKDVTGYQLITGRFNPKTLFGKEGELRRLRTMVLSQQPSVTMHFKKFECEALRKLFREKTNLRFNILGGAISGSSDSGYEFKESNYNESAQSLDVTFTPPEIGSVGSAEKQKAYVLGGVIDYIDNNVKVNKIRILSDENSAEDPNFIPEGCNGLNLMYRKNEDGKYEYAGLYDQKKDLDYMIGDTVAIPIKHTL